MNHQTGSSPFIIIHHLCYGSTERLFKIGYEIVGSLYADRHPYQAVRDTEPLPVFMRHIRV
jgi:hypothetical protein